MQITSIRRKGKKLAAPQLTALASKIGTALKRAGFDTSVYVKGAAIAIANGRGCFTIDPAKHGYNVRLGYYNGFGQYMARAPKRTTVPTWEQREAFNHLLNDVLDAARITASIRSAGFVVRWSDGRVDEWDRPLWIAGIETLTEEITQDLEARRRARANARARERRAYHKGIKEHTLSLILV